MRELRLISLDYALPALQAYLARRDEEPLDSSEAADAAELLEQCVRTGEALVALALRLGGRPSPQ